MSSFQSQFLMNSIPCIRFLDNHARNKISLNMSKSGGDNQIFVPHSKNWGDASLPPPHPPRIDAHEIICFRKATLTFKLLHKMGRKSLTDLFTHKTEIINYELRGISSSLRLPKPRTIGKVKKAQRSASGFWRSYISYLIQSIQHNFPAKKTRKRL